MASGGGGAWKVAYADFVTAMMAFFMVMWLTSQKPEIRQAVAEHFRNPGGKRLSGHDAQSVVPSHSTGNGSRRVIKAKGMKKSDGETKYKQMTDEGERSNVGTIVSFELNSVHMTEQGREEILQLLPELEGKQHRLEIRGHSANNGSSSPQANMDAWNISYQRSMAVMQLLIEQGIDPRRIRLSQAGNSEPRLSNGSSEQANDSRVEVFVLTELFEEPSSKTQRLVSNKSLDKEAIELEKKDKAAAAAAPAAPKKH
jgi:chemotaxis protein MotB